MANRRSSNRLCECCACYVSQFGVLLCVQPLIFTLRLNSRNHIRHRATAVTRDNSFKLSSIRVGKLNDTYRRQPAQNEPTIIVRRSTTSDVHGTNLTTVEYTATVPKLVRYSHLLTTSKLMVFILAEEHDYDFFSELK